MLLAWARLWSGFLEGESLLERGVEGNVDSHGLGVCWKKPFKGNCLGPHIVAGQITGGSWVRGAREVCI